MSSGGVQVPPTRMALTLYKVMRGRGLIELVRREAAAI